MLLKPSWSFFNKAQSNLRLRDKNSSTLLPGREKAKMQLEEREPSFDCLSFVRFFWFVLNLQKGINFLINL